MASRYHWRQRLLGSLQGQLQLATYLVVFLGFTGASSVGLLIGQRNLLANNQQLVRQSLALCEEAISGVHNEPARLEQELLFRSPANTSLWIGDKRLVRRVSTPTASRGLKTHGVNEQTLAKRANKKESPQLAVEGDAGGLTNSI